MLNGSCCQYRSTTKRIHPTHIAFLQKDHPTSQSKPLSYDSKVAGVHLHGITLACSGLSKTQIQIVHQYERYYSTRWPNISEYLLPISNWYCSSECCNFIFQHCINYSSMKDLYYMQSICKLVDNTLDDKPSTKIS